MFLHLSCVVLLSRPTGLKKQRQQHTVVNWVIFRFNNDDDDSGNAFLKLLFLLFLNLIIIFALPTRNTTLRPISWCVFELSYSYTRQALTSSPHRTVVLPCAYGKVIRNLSPREFSTAVWDFSCFYYYFFLIIFLLLFSIILSHFY